MWSIGIDTIRALPRRVARFHRRRRLPGCLAAGVLVLSWSALARANPQEPAQGLGGQVVSAADGRPIAGAQVAVEGTQLGAITDNRGRFLILNVPGTEATVRAIMIGYRDAVQTVAVGRMDLVVQLSEAAVALDQIVVTGTAGGQRTRAIGNVVGNLDAAELQAVAPSTDVQQMLNGRVPGVRIMSTGGAVGTGGVMRIRGAASVSLGGAPLVYVDGVRVSGGPTGGVGTFAFPGGRAPNRINDLSPSDIESIEVDRKSVV